MSEEEGVTISEPKWLIQLKKAGPYAAAAAIGALVVSFGNVADGLGKLYGLIKMPEAFVLADKTAISTFSDQLAQRAWRRIFWGDNFRNRVVHGAPISDIDDAWKAYIDADAEWNANIMISIVGLERWYGAKRSEQLEGDIQPLFSKLDDELAELRRTELIRAIRSGNEPTGTQRSEGENWAKKAKETSDKLKAKLYVLVRCFPEGKRDTNSCV